MYTCSLIKAINENWVVTSDVIESHSSSVCYSRSTILLDSKSLLRGRAVSDQAITEALVSTMLLEDSSPRQALADFLLARKASIQQLLNQPQHGEHQAEGWLSQTGFRFLVGENTKAVSVNAADCSYRMEIDCTWWDVFFGISFYKSQSLAKGLKIVLLLNIAALTFCNDNIWVKIGNDNSIWHYKQY